MADLRTPPSYDFSKDRIPRDRSWPNKRSELDAAFVAYGVEQLSVVYFLMGSAKQHSWGQLAAAHFGRAEYLASGRWHITLTIYSVLSSERHRIHGLFVDGGLQRICEWLASAPDRGNVWQSKRRSLMAYAAPLGIRLEDDEGPLGGR